MLTALKKSWTLHKPETVYHPEGLKVNSSYRKGGYKWKLKLTLKVRT